MTRSEESGGKLWSTGPYQHDCASIRIRDHVLVAASHSAGQAPEEESSRTGETIVYPTNGRDRLSRQRVFTGLLRMVSEFTRFL